MDRPFFRQDIITNEAYQQNLTASAEGGLSVGGRMPGAELLEVDHLSEALPSL